MKSAKIMAAALAAVFVLSAASALFTDGSDGYTWTDGETGIGYKVKDPSSEDLALLFPDDARTELAKNILGHIVDDGSLFTISEIKVSDYSASGYLGNRVDGKETVVLDASSNRVCISFKAVCDTAGLELFKNNARNEGLMKATGADNKTQTGAEFKVDAEYRLDRSMISTDTFEKVGDNFLLTSERIESRLSSSIEADVSYAFKVADEDRTIDFDLKVGELRRYDVGMELDFQSVALQDVTAGTRALVDYDFDTYIRSEWDKVKYDGSTMGPDNTITDPLNPVSEIPNIAYGEAVFNDGDIAAEEYRFYGDSLIDSLFTNLSDIDDSLRTDDAMKSFLERVGKVYTTYSDAESGAEGILEPFDLDLFKKFVTYGGIIAGVAIVLIIAAIVAIVKLSKR